MKNLIVLIFFVLTHNAVMAQKPKTDTRSPSKTEDCAVCKKRDSQGNCKEWDFSKCKPDVIIAKFKQYNDITTGEKRQEVLQKNVFADSSKGELSSNWVVSGTNKGTVILVNAKKSTTAGIKCNACCSIVVEGNTVRCAKGRNCTDCGIIVVTPLPATRNFSTRK